MRTVRYSLAMGMVLFLVGCGTQVPLRATATPTPDMQATIAAGIQATQTAQAQQEAQVATAVAATQTASATTAATEVPATSEGAVPVPTATPVNPETYVTLTEEELAALIDEAVQEAVVATEAAAEATSSATADESLTTEEVQTLEVTVAGAEEAIALAEELLYVYAELYGELATETVAMVDEMEELLAATTEMVIVMTDLIADVDTALEQGMALTAEMIEQLQEAAQAADVRAEALQAQAEQWSSTVQSELASRAESALAVQATEIAANRREAITSAYSYLDVTRGALQDNRVTQQELTAIAQAGANASASLRAQGGPQLEQVAGRFEEITASVARGQLPQVQGQLSALEGSLPERPSRP